nr:tetratricopeptide repeat protein [Streptomyces sp. CMB-StM0423]
MVAELLAALLRASTHQHSADDAWRSWITLTAAEAADGSAAVQSWQSGRERQDDPAALLSLAEALVEETRARPDMGVRLWRWVEKHRAATYPKGQVNSIGGGDTRIYGPTVQAHAIHGGLHVHYPATRPQPPPRQLLPVPAHFTGRQEDLAALGRLMTTESGTRQSLLVVSGPGGIGKSALVTKWLQELGTDFPDGHFYADLRGHSVGGPASPGEVLGQFLRALGTRSVPAELAEQTALWRSVTADRNVMVMLDNAFTAAQVRPLLPGGTGGLVVVTSRHMLTGLGVDGARFYRLGGLDPDAGLELLARGIGSERVAREPQAARELAELCAGLPLAVCLASARLASRPRQPVQVMAEALVRKPGDLITLEVEGEAAVQTALNASYAGLTEDGAAVYRRLGLLPVRTFDTQIIAACCGKSLDWADHLMGELIEVSLLEEVGPGTCRFHDLVRLHARDRALRDEPEPEREEVLRRVCDWYLATVTAAEERLTPAQFTLPRNYAFPSELPLPFDEKADALGWLDSRRMDLMGVLSAAVDHGWDETAWQLVDASWPLYLHLRHYDLWIESHEIGLAAARRSGNDVAERQMLNSGAIGLAAAERTDDAIRWYSASAEAARTAGDVRDEGQAFHGLGGCHHHAGRRDEAVRHLNQAIVLWEDCGYPRGTALARIVLGEIALAEGSPGTAVECFREAHRVMVAVEDTHDAARALTFLGHAHIRTGKFDQGVEELTEALAVFATSGSSHWQARTLEMLGEGSRERGDVTAAGEFYARAYALHKVRSPLDAERVRACLDELHPSDEPPERGSASE